MSYTNFVKAMELAPRCKFYTTAGGKTEAEIKKSETLLSVSFSSQCKEFYEKYGFEFYTMVLGDGESEMSRMYIHR